MTVDESSSCPPGEPDPIRADVSDLDVDRVSDSPRGRPYRTLGPLLTALEEGGTTRDIVALTREHVDDVATTPEPMGAVAAEFERKLAQRITEALPERHLDPDLQARLQQLGQDFVYVRNAAPDDVIQMDVAGLLAEVDAKFQQVSGLGKARGPLWEAVHQALELLSDIDQGAPREAVEAGMRSYLEHSRGAEMDEEMIALQKRLFEAFEEAVEYRYVDIGVRPPLS